MLRFISFAFVLLSASLSGNAQTTVSTLLTTLCPTTGTTAAASTASTAPCTCPTTAASSTASTPASTTVATTMASGSAQLFTYDGNKVVTTCPAGQNITWYYYTWKAGSTRPYYENQGRRNSLDECVSHCAKKAECYFAKMTSSKTCYFLTTTNPAACTYANNHHYGKAGENCDLFNPCPSAYKVCAEPNCSLVSIIYTYCRTLDQSSAKSHCVKQFPRDM